MLCLVFRSFWTSSCLSSASKSNPPLFLTPFGLSPASPPLQGPILRYFSLLLDFRASPSTSKSILPLFLAPFGLPRASPPLQSPIYHSCSLLLDFRASPLHFKVQSTALPRSTTQKRRIAKQSASLNPPVSINQSNPPSANSTK